MTNTDGLVQLIVALDEAYAAKVGGGTISGINEVDQLVKGAVAIFDDQNNLVPTGYTLPASVQQFHIVVGAGNGVYAKSDPFDRNPYQFSYKDGVAPVKQVTHVGESNGNGSLNPPSVLTTDQQATVIVTDLSIGEHTPGQVKRYTYAVKASDDNDAVVAGVVAQINADSSAIVTASILTNLGNVGIALTAKNYNHPFQASGDDNYADADVWTNGEENSVALNRGIGTYTALKEVEHVASIQQGSSNFGGQHHLYDKQFSMVDVAFPNQLDSDTPLNVWDIEWMEEHRTPTGIAGRTPKQLTIAVVDGTTVETNLKTIFGVIITAADTGSGGSPAPQND